jgi:hypothetical protein
MSLSQGILPKRIPEEENLKQKHSPLIQILQTGSGVDLGGTDPEIHADD